MAGAAGNSETVLMVGATSSLMQALARKLARRGQPLILAGRDGEELELLAADLGVRARAVCRVLAADFTAADFSAEAFIAQAGEFGHAVIGIGDMGTGSPSDLANIASLIHVNYTLPAQIAGACAEALSIRQRGTVTLISSVAGDRGRQSNYPYGSAKAALSAFASGLRNRYSKHGVHVMTVKPGFVDTPMTWGMKSPLIAGRDYVAKKIVQALSKRKDVIYVPFFWRFIMLVITHIPERIFKRMKL